MGHPGQAADHEHRHEADGEQHRGVERQSSPPDRPEPVEDLDTGRHGNGHGRQPEGSLGDRGNARREHVVGPHAESEEADGGTGEDHGRVAEQGLAGERRQHLGHDAHGGQDEDVDLGVPEQPEEVLPQDRISACRCVEEQRPEVPIEGDHEQCHRDDRQREQEQERHHRRHPHEHRHPHEAHALGPHVEHRHDEVHG